MSNPLLKGLPRSASWITMSLWTCAALPALAQTALPDRLVGDVGAAVYATPSIVRGASDRPVLLPYVYADDGRLFGRVDTFGYKVLPLGWGYLELAGRVSMEGFKIDSPALPGIGERSNPVPLGLSTFQETPWGGWFLNAFRDTISGGTLLEATWAGEWRVGSLSVYPQLGVERRSARYTQRLYGVSGAEARASGLAAYSPGASTVPVLGLALQLPLDHDWSLNLQWRRRWLDAAITDSPLVDMRRQDSGFVALTYTFH